MENHIYNISIGPALSRRIQELEGYYESAATLIAEALVIGLTAIEASLNGVEPGSVTVA